MSLEIPKETWTGQVREVTLGATSEQGGSRKSTITVGGETTLPFLTHEGAIPHPAALAVEIRSSKPEGWSPLLEKAWGEAMNDPAEWAKAAEEAGADLLYFVLNATDSSGSPTTPEKAVEAVRNVLEASTIPLAVIGPGQSDLDNELLVPAAEAAEGERLLLGTCEEKNYRTIVAAALAHNHLVQSRTPMDVNLSKQLVILIHDMGMPLERIVLDPTTGALGYGIEYGFSVMERLRLAALTGDTMTQQPMIVTPGEEVWKVKEAKIGSGVPETWGDWETRALEWEAVTAATLIHSGADIVVLRHPHTLQRLQHMITDLSSSHQPEE
ncbi:MAG: acetyl-CoA decarbonylase/synthase complex subunit delta [Anaerolineales bacterium]|nr:acetyl-CoA decarbonylase/synthase complex subunit delta [Anaerolineales bacterium]